MKVKRTDNGGIIKNESISAIAESRQSRSKQTTADECWEMREMGDERFLTEITSDGTYRLLLRHCQLQGGQQRGGA